VKAVILFRIDAGHDIGMGHLYRMMRLSHFFKSDAYDVRFALRRDPVAEKLLKRGGYQFIALDAGLDEENIIDAVVKTVKPFVWIYDMLDTEHGWIANLKMRGIKVVCFDDRKGGILSADLVINPIVGCWGQIEKGHAPVFNGPEFAVLSQRIKRFRRKRHLHHGFSDTMTIGISMGGSDTHGATVMLAKALAGIKAPNFFSFFFLGPSYAHNTDLNIALSKCSYSYAVETYTDDLFKELDRMNMVICGGGVTLFEVCAMGLPALSLANELHEKKTIAFFKKYGAVIGLGSVHETNPQALTGALMQSLSKLDMLNRLGMNGMDLVDTLGGDRSYQLIKEYCVLSEREISPWC
jgi:spore coat polysaccharide biosynthesis predicted glycosyltransferase SpsG